MRVIQFAAQRLRGDLIAGGFLGGVGGLPRGSGGAALGFRGRLGRVAG